MAVTNAIPEVWAARWLYHFERAGVWDQLFTDVSEALSAAGDAVNIPYVSNADAVKGFSDYTREQVIPAPTFVAANTRRMPITQMKYQNIAIDNVDEMQTRPMIMDEVLRLSTAGIAQAKNDRARAVFQAGVAAGAADHREVIASATAANINADGFASAFRTALRNIGAKMDEDSVPEMGRWFVMGPKVKWALVDEVVGETVTSQRREQAYIQGQIGETYGFMPVVDAGIEAATAEPRAYAGIRPAMLFNVRASQLRNVRLLDDDPRYFADVAQSLYVYDYGVMDSEYNYNISWTAV